MHSALISSIVRVGDFLSVCFEVVSRMGAQEHSSHAINYDKAISIMSASYTLLLEWILT